MKKKLTPYSDDANDFYIAKYTAEASQFYEKKMLQLVDGDREKLRTEVPNVPLPDHMAYKLEPLFSADGHRQYEFLIEYHTKKPSEGIYYGCRGITLKGYNHNEEIEQFRRDWETVKSELCVILNNTFPGKNFNFRFRMTDNANDETYWLFWISLVEDEDIKEVGRCATEIIRKVFESYLAGAPIGQHKISQAMPKVETAFDDDAWKYLLKRIGALAKDDCAEECQKLFDNFVDGAKFQKLLIENRNYSKALSYQGETNAGFARLINAFFEVLHDRKLTKDERFSVPWKGIIKVFLDKDGHTFGEEIKTQVEKKMHDKKLKEINDYKRLVESFLETST